MKSYAIGVVLLLASAYFHSILLAGLGGYLMGRTRDQLY